MTALHTSMRLASLKVQETKVSLKGLAEFHAAVPGCAIEHDGGTITAVDVDRNAAEWVVSVGGTVNVQGGPEIKAVAGLPNERFTLTEVRLHSPATTDADLVNLRSLKGLLGLTASHTKVTDDGLLHLKDHKGVGALNLGGTAVTGTGLAHLKDLKGLMYLNLASSKITDAGLVHLKEHKGLTSLVLYDTAVTDIGLGHLKTLEGLTSLELGGTAVTDTGLAHLQVLKGLKSLKVLKTKVTAKGLADFHAAVPGCKIESDHGTFGPK